MNRTSRRRHKQKKSDQTLESNDSRFEDSNETSDDDEEEEDDDDDDDQSTYTDDTEDESLRRKREWEALAKYLRSQRAYIERHTPDSFHKFRGEKKEKKDKTTQKNLTSPMPSIWKPPVYKEISAAPGFKLLKSKEIHEKENEFEDIMLRYITKLQTNNKAYKSEGRKQCPHKATENVKKLCSKHKKQAESKEKRGRREGVHTCMDATVSNLTENVLEPEKMRGAEWGGGRCERKCSDERGRTREKLMYVVEEEGKSVAKMETDLFSLNEILAIKKDLLELSEFAKKLKKLKEMRKDSEKEKRCGAECQCKPLAELLKGVNKRMEALEKRQEELERGIQKGRDTETDTKKTDERKTFSASPPLGTAKAEPSAVKSVSSFAKTDVTNVSRDGGEAFSKNLEIVNELLDIKNQLQRLERKRMSKELSPETGAAGVAKNKGKDHAINVFSSKTYILTTEAYNKKKAKETSSEEKMSHVDPKEKSSPSQEVKVNNVADWLKNISSPEKSNSDVNVYMASRNPTGNKNLQEENWGTRRSFKERSRNFILDGDDFENQEPQKNRAKGTVRRESSRGGPKPSIEVQNCKDIPEKPSLRDEPWERNDSLDRHPAKKPPRYIDSTCKPRRTGSSSSIPSAVLVKEQAQRLRRSGFTPKPTHAVKHSRSKSVHEFTSTSLSKDEKTMLNTSRKNLEEKSRKELEERINKLGKLSQLGSQFVASMNLEEGSKSFDKENISSCPLPVFPFPILPANLMKIIECCEEGKHEETNRATWCRRTSHTNEHKGKEKDKFQKCINKCCKKKKTSVKSSGNQCSNKKTKKAASRSKKLCRHKTSTPSCCSAHQKKKKKECESYKPPKKTCCVKKFAEDRSCSRSSTSSSSSTESTRTVQATSNETTVFEDNCSSECFRKSKKWSCKSEKPKPKPCYRKTNECHCKEQSPEETSKTSSDHDTSTAGMDCESQERKEHFRTSTSQKESTLCGKPTKSSYKNQPRLRTIQNDPCYVGNFWKSIRKLYPKFSTLQLMSWLKLYCQEEKVNACSTQNEQRERRRDEGEHRPRRGNSKPHACSDHQHKAQSQRFVCCKCDGIRQSWPGVSPSSELPDDNITEAETQSSNTSRETDFMFPYRKSEQYYAYRAKTKEGSNEESYRKKKKKKREKEKSTSEESDSDEKKCKCKRCGNVHTKKAKKKNGSVQETQSQSDTEGKKSKGPRKSIFSKLGEVRHLRVCDKKFKCPSLKFTKSKEACRCASGEKKCKCGNEEKSKKSGEGCNCHSKLANLEDRVKYLEYNKGEKNNKNCSSGSDSKHGSDDKKCKKKKKKKRKHSKSRESSNGSANEECKMKKKKKDSSSSFESEDTEENGKKKKKKKKKKRKKKRESSSNSECENNEENGKKKKKKKGKKERESSSNSESENNEENGKKKKKKKGKKEKESSSNPECENNEENGKKKKKKKGKKERESSSNSEGENNEENGKKKKKKKGKKERESSSDSECENNEENGKKKKKKKKKKERESSSDSECENNEENGKKKKKKKKKKKRSESESGDGAENNIKKFSNENCKCKEEERKKEKKKKQKTKYSDEVQDERQEECHYCKCVNKNFDTGAQSGEKTVTPTPPEKSYLRRRVDSSLEALRKKKQEVLEKLPSFSSFWNGLRGRKRADEDSLIDDPSRSSELPKKRSLRRIEDEPSFLENLRKSKKREKEKVKKKRVPKSKSRTRRHWH